MQLPGRLRGTTLGDLLGTLYRAGASGVLELIETHGAGAGRSHRVRLEQGLVTVVETAHEVPRLGELLLARGELRASALVGLVRELSAGQVLSGRWLLERRLVSSETVARALHEQQRLRLEPLFALEDCLVRFRVPRPSLGDVTRPAPLDVSEFLHGRPRARGNRSARRRAVSEGPWQVLGLTSEASLDDVKRAFRRLAAKSHPDRFPNASAEERGRLMRDFAELSCAYHALIA